MTLALDLAWRGLQVVIVDRRPADAPPDVRCSQISARSMEVFRRLGLAHKLREVGLPADYPNDVVSATTVVGTELSRVSIPAWGEREGSPVGPDTSWLTPEHTHRVNQLFFEPVLRGEIARHSRIRVLHHCELTGFTQHEQGVSATASDHGREEPFSIECSYLVGCDGAASQVRKAIGAEFVGTPVLQRAQSIYIRAPALLSMLTGKRAWMYKSLNPRRCGLTLAVDGRETWLIHNYLYGGGADGDAGDHDWVTRAILGVGPEFPYETISTHDWVARRLVATKLQDRRVFICGDAAHVWIPFGGYGMNAGIADAANLAWKLAAVSKGWAAPAILHSYDAERRPITDQASRLISDVAQKVGMQQRSVSADVDRQDSVGDAVRAQIGKEAYDLDVLQQCCGGLNFGYYYEGSSIVAYDDERPPSYTMGTFTSSTVPGCRAPHLWLDGHRSLYDSLGPDYALLRLDPAARVTGIVDAAAERQVPLRIVDVKSTDALGLYRHKLALIRPDQHVAWRGDDEPAAPLDLIDRVRGAQPALTETHGVMPT